MGGDFVCWWVILLRSQFYFQSQSHGQMSMNPIQRLGECLLLFEIVLQFFLLSLWEIPHHSKSLGSTPTFYLETLQKLGIFKVKVMAKCQWTNSKSWEAHSFFFQLQFFFIVVIFIVVTGNTTFYLETLQKLGSP